MLIVKMIICVIIDNMGPATKSGCIDNPPTPPPWNIHTRHLSAQSQEHDEYTRRLAIIQESWAELQKGIDSVIGSSIYFFVGGSRDLQNYPQNAAVCACFCQEQSMWAPDILYWDLSLQPHTMQLIWHSWENARTGRSTTGSPFSSQITGIFSTMSATLMITLHTVLYIF